MRINYRSAAFAVAYLGAVTAATAQRAERADKNVSAAKTLRRPTRVEAGYDRAVGSVASATATAEPLPRTRRQLGTVTAVHPGTLVYQNSAGATAIYRPGANQLMADDLTLRVDGCDVAYYSLRVQGNGVGTFTVTTALYDADPCSGGVIIPGSEAVFTPSHGVETTLEVTLATPVAAPGTVFLAATFSDAAGGWIVTEEAEIGSTADEWSENDPGRVPPCGSLAFVDPTIHAGFWAEITCDVTTATLGACCNGVTCAETTEAACPLGNWLGAFTTCSPNPCLSGACCTGMDFATCADGTEATCTGTNELFRAGTTCATSPCVASFKGYENTFDTGQFVDIAAGTLFGDDIQIASGATCELVAYDFEMVGTIDALIKNFSVTTELWTNNDSGTIGDATDDVPGLAIPGTQASFTGVPANQIAKKLLAGPFSGTVLDSTIWLVMSTDYAGAGPGLGGDATVGFSANSFAVFNDPSGLGVWTPGFGFMGGFEPMGCPGLPPPGGTCVPAGSFRVNLWCLGVTPIGACCSDGAGSCIDAITEQQCDGRWLPDVTCASLPFTPPCGTAACCQQFGCSDTPIATCIALGGAPAVGFFCANEGTMPGDLFTCPRPDCRGAVGDCLDPFGNGTPGCNDAFCCDLVCQPAPAGDPFCCTTDWDNTCATTAAALCKIPPANDFCANAAAIAGVGSFPFDNTNAVTDGAPHNLCSNVGGDEQVTSDIWYSWTSPCTDEVFVRTCTQTSVDTKLAVYDASEACPPSSASLLTCNDDICASQSMVRFQATTGASYRIRVGTFPGGAGSVRAPGGVGRFSITCGPPPNLACGPGAGATNDCCVPAPSTVPKTKACADTACCELVCACDAFCCDVEWDTGCAGGGSGGSGCGAAALCTTACPAPACPPGVISFIDPVGGSLDARQPHTPQDALTGQGYDTFAVTGPVNLDAPLSCWSVCETGGLTDNSVAVFNALGNDYTLVLNRPITPGQVTTITYTDDNGLQTTTEFISHPGNVNGDGFTDTGDLASLFDCISGVTACDLDRCDLDRSGRCANGDILRLIDVLNGGDALQVWLNTALPVNSGVCP